MSDASRPLVLLTIAGFDPSSGAGITADLKTFSAHGLFGVSCITALTVQSTQGVREVACLDEGLASRTLACLADDMVFAGVKIGMLGSGKMVQAVAGFLERASIPRGKIVLDPVLRSSSGAALLDGEGLARMRDALLPQVGWATPNISELGVVLGADIDGSTVIEAEALRLQTAYSGLEIVVTGGESERPDDYYLPTTGEGTWLRGERIETNSTHGTGCAFSSALLSQLTLGKSGIEAVARAKTYVTEAMRYALPIGKGKGPLNHLFSQPTP